jgi:hypothetical protein
MGERFRRFRPFAYLGSLLRQVLVNQQCIIGNQNMLLERTKLIMASQADLDAALQAEGTDLQAATAALTALEQKLAGITPGQPAPDLSAEVAQIGQFRSALQTLAANMTTDASKLGGDSSSSGSGSTGSTGSTSTPSAS